MPTFYDWLKSKKGISEYKFNNLVKEKRIALRQEWCGQFKNKQHLMARE